MGRFEHNETNPKIKKAKNPCPAKIFSKRKSSVVSDALVSKLSNLFGADAHKGFTKYK